MRGARPGSRVRARAGERTGVGAGARVEAMHGQAYPDEGIIIIIIINIKEIDRYGRGMAGVCGGYGGGMRGV